MFNKCLILGGSGFIGAKLVESLLFKGLSVRTFDRASLESNSLKGKYGKFLECVTGDFLNQDDIDLAMVDCDCCVHLITTTMPQSSNENIQYDVQSNLIGTLGVLDAAVRNKVKKVVFISSGGTVYGTPQYLPIDEKHPTEPISSYGIIKLSIEKYLGLYKALYSLDSVALRLANPYGEGQRIDRAQGVIASFLNKAITSDVVDIWGDGSNIRDYIYIDDAVRAIIAAINYKGLKKVFNIATGVGSSLLDIVDAIQGETKNKLNIRYHPKRIFDVPVNCLDISLARDELLWEPKIPLNEGVGRMYHWMLSET